MNYRERHCQAFAVTTLQPAVEIYSGEDNPLSSKRKYGIVYNCVFDLALYPFDVQECLMRLRITSAGKAFLTFDSEKSSVEHAGSRLLPEYEASGRRGTAFGEAALSFLVSFHDLYCCCLQRQR